MDYSLFQATMISAIWIVPIVTAVVELIKKTFGICDTRYIPIISAVVGLVAGLAIVSFSLLGGLVGLMIGLAATGLFEISKTSIAGK